MAHAGGGGNHESAIDTGSWTLIRDRRRRFSIAGAAPSDGSILAWDREHAEALIETSRWPQSRLSSHDRKILRSKLSVARLRILELYCGDFSERDRTLIIRALGARQRLAEVNRWNFNPLEILLALLVIGGAVALIWLSQLSASTWLGATPSLSSFIYCGIGTLLAIAAAEYVYDELDMELSGRAALSALLLFALISLTGVALYGSIVQVGLEPSAVYEVSLGILVAAVLLPGWLGITTRIGNQTWLQSRPNRKYVDQPLAVLVASMVDVAARLIEHREDLIEFDAGRLRYRRGGGTMAGCRIALDELETAARSAEARFAVLAPSAYPALKSWYAQAGKKLAATLRSYQRLVVDPNPDSLEIALWQVREAIRILASGEWHSLMSEEADKLPIASMWRRLIPRVLLSGTLLALAIFGPSWLPPTVLPSDFESIRATLVVAAVFAAAVPDADKARETLLNVFSRK